MRDYDPTTGRYLQGDPLGLVDGASVYGYAGQSPINNVDRRGEEWVEFSGTDGNTYMEWKPGGPTYCPSGACASESPTSNVHPESEFAQCKQECESIFNLEGWKTEPHGACAAIGGLLGLFTGGSVAVSGPASSMCRSAYCTEKCANSCGLYE